MVATAPKANIYVLLDRPRDEDNPMQNEISMNYNLLLVVNVSICYLLHFIRFWTQGKSSLDLNVISQIESDSQVFWKDFQLNHNTLEFFNSYDTSCIP